MTTTDTPTTLDALRPQGWDEFIGQDELKARLQVHISAAVAEDRPLDHVFLAAPPGFGKTSLSSIIARRLDDPFLSVVMPVKPRVLERMLRQFEGGVLLMDEIHRAPKSQQEDLLTVLEDGYLQQDDGRRTETGWLTIVGATTEPEKVIPPLYDRFPIKPVLVPYTDEEMARIIRGMATKVEVDLADDVVLTLARATGGTPRNARQFVLSARDLFLQPGIDNPDAELILNFCGVDPEGLDHNHMAYMTALEGLGGTAGLAPLCTMLRLHPSVVQNIEQTLLGKGFISYTKAGRELLSPGYKKLAGSKAVRTTRRDVA